MAKKAQPVKKIRGPRKTVAAALRANGLSQEDLRILLKNPQVAEAAALAALRKISSVRRSVQRQVRELGRQQKTAMRNLLKQLSK